VVLVVVRLPRGATPVRRDGDRSESPAALLWGCQNRKGAQAHRARDRPSPGM